MATNEIIQRALIYGPVILLSLTVHEFFHAWSAHKFGDDTARNLGRMSLNPLVHLDFFGTLAMVLSQFTFGWAKPVPVNPLNLRNPRVADLWISAAGPLSNLGLALVCGLVFQSLTLTGYAAEVLTAMVVINITLAIFNLIPLYPLDGSHILRNLLPPEYASSFDRFSRFAPFLLLIVIVTGLFWRLFGPIAMALARLFLGY